MGVQPEQEKLVQAEQGEVKHELGGSESPLMFAQPGQEVFTPEMLRRQWEPMEEKSIPKWSLPGFVKFYFIGLTNNSKLKATYMEMFSKLEVLSQRAKAISEQWMNLQKERMNMEYYQHMGVLNTERRGSIRHESQLLIYECEDLIRKLEGYLLVDPFGVLNLKVYELLHMASCPLDQFVQGYLARRDNALHMPCFPPDSLENACQLEETRQQQMDKEKQMAKAAVRSIAQMEILFEALKVKIDTNDQLLFKLFLVAVNIATCLGQYLYDRYQGKEPEQVKCV